MCHDLKCSCQVHINIQDFALLLWTCDNRDNQRGAKYPLYLFIDVLALSTSTINIMTSFPQESAGGFRVHDGVFVQPPFLCTRSTKFEIKEADMVSPTIANGRLLAGALLIFPSLWRYNIRRYC